MKAGIVSAAIGVGGVASLNLNANKFVDEWVPKLSFVQYKRQDCTNGMHGLKIAYPCLSADAKTAVLGAGATEANIEAHFSAAAAPGFASKACGGDGPYAAKYPKLHAILQPADAGGKTSTQLDLAAEMCSKSKDCGGFVQINKDADFNQTDASKFVDDDRNKGLQIKLLVSPSSGSGKPSYQAHPVGAKRGDVVFLKSDQSCAARLFLNSNPDEKCTSATDPKLCHSACVRASHCDEDQKENTYIKKRIIMSAFGSSAEAANQAEETFEGTDTTTPTTA